MSSGAAKKLTLIALILMIFTSVFGFTNILRAYYLMSYAALPWYILASLFFFLPYAFMIAEFGSAFKDESGGIYAWMSKSVNPKYAFIATFMWYASYIIWQVSICGSIWIVLSNGIFGKDLTNTWELFGLNSTQTMGFLGVCLAIAITFIASKGVDKITKVTSFGGMAVTLLNVVLFVGAILIFVLNGGELAQPIESVTTSFSVSPHPDYQNTIAISSFLVFAIFAFGGIEVVGGLSDKTQNAEVTFPKGVTIAAFTIVLGYAIGIVLCGIFTDWRAVLSDPNVHMGNAPYVLMENLGYQLGLAMGLTQETSTTMGLIVSRYMGISMFLALLGAFFVLVYSPLKQLIEGTPDKMWPKFIKESKNDMPVNAMYVQCAIVVVFIILVSFGGENASKFFAKLILMTNVAMTVPYILVALAFPYFKKKEEIAKPFVVYKSRTAVLVATFLVVLVVGFANIATVLDPYISRGDVVSSIWMFAGPLFFTILALIIYKKYEKNA